MNVLEGRFELKFVNATDGHTHHAEFLAGLPGDGNPLDGLALVSGRSRRDGALADHEASASQLSALASSCSRFPCCWSWIG